ncbi:MAG: fumarylacetoacetate hydrolase family protein [Burkholderiales bacterium]|nr:fumarylacetoacetate hydrolase family protein [Burkholderiales bacterium]
MNTDQIDTLAQALDDASIRAVAIPPLSKHHAVTIDEAYRIQQATVARRLARGERVVGIKMGFTSRAKMAQMGVHEQIFGQLTDAMRVDNGASISLAHFIHPRGEPELAFLLKRSLPADVTEDEAREAIQSVAAAIEIVDSRYEAFKFSLTDVIADNASAVGFVLGPWTACPAQLLGLEMTLTIDGEPRQLGSSSEILGDPLRSLVAAARLAAQAGMPLQAGWIVLAGAATSAEALTAGSCVDARVKGIGSVGFRVHAEAIPAA